MTLSQAQHGWELVEADQASDWKTRLARAWDGDSSLLLAPARRGIDGDWMSDALGLIPQEFSNNHFGVLTSGSTGRPKLVIGNKRRAEQLVGEIHRAQVLSAVKVAVSLLPLTYSYAFVNQWLWAHCYDRTMIRSPGMAEPIECSRLLHSADESMVCLVAPLFRLLAAALGDGEAFLNVTCVNFAGAPFPWAERNEIARIFPNAAVFSNYGCTEALPRLTVTPQSDLRGPGDIGCALAGIELRTNPESELQFKSIYGAVGIVESGQFRHISPDEWLQTNDLAEEIEPNRFRLKGRQSEVYKRYGEKISIAQQIALLETLALGQIAAYADHDASGEQGHVLVLSPDRSDEQIREVLKIFRKHFSRAHWPLRIESVELMPLLPNGKADVASLKTTTRHLRWKLPI